MRITSLSSLMSLLALSFLITHLNVSYLEAQAQSTNQNTPSAFPNATTISTAQSTPADTLAHYRAKALRFAKETPIIDGHNDLPWQLRSRAKNQLNELKLSDDTAHLEPPMHTDLNRLRLGRMGGQFWSVYVPATLPPSQAVQATLEQIDVVKRMIDQYSGSFGLALSARDVVRLHKQGKVASLIGMEGGHSIGHSLAVLRQMYELGARYMTITHSKTSPWADSATDAPQHQGLTEFGEAVIREMNRLGMIIDLSHVSADTMRDTLRVTSAPVIFSHSGAGGVCPHPRNVPSDVLDTLKENGGVVMVIFLTGYVKCERAEWWASQSGERARLEALYPGRPTAVDEGMKTWHETHPAPRVDLDDVIKHIDYIRERIGAEHIGLGGDFDGMGPGPIGLEDVSKYPDLIAQLLAQGYSETEVKGIMGDNVLRVMREVEKVAQKQSSKRADDRPPLHWVEHP